MKTLTNTASALVIRDTPGGADTGKRIEQGEIVQAHGTSFDSAWTFVVAKAGAGWASSGYLSALATPAVVSPLGVAARAAWGSKYPAVQKMNPGPKSLVVVHHFATPDVPPIATVEQEESAMRQVESYHVETHGWKAIGYSFVVFASGRIYEGRGWGMVGAHTPGKNSSAHGIAFAVNGELHSLTLQAIAAFRALVHEGVRRGFVASDWKIGGHRDYDDTTCPGDKVYAQLGALHS